MVLEAGPIYVDTTDVPATGTPVALTSREIHCNSVLLLPNSGNTGSVYIVDSNDDSKTRAIPVGGLTLPVSNPAIIKVDAEVSGDDVDWIAL